MKIATYAEHATRAGQLVLGEHEEDSDDIEIHEGSEQDLGEWANGQLQNPKTSAFRARVARSVLDALGWDDA